MYFEKTFEGVMKGCYYIMHSKKPAAISKIIENTAG